MKTYKLPKMLRRDKKPDILRNINSIVVHHSASPTSTTFKQIYRWHTIERGWSDVGYHFVILGDGTIQEGRDINKTGAHCRACNKTSVGICVTGNTNNVKPNPQQLESLHDLLECLQYDFNIEIEHVYTHREKGKTECPGNHLQEWMNEYRSL
jgi:N-acetyl-anhydromuramyl-L-alanine amidase AmpD